MMLLKIKFQKIFGFTWRTPPLKNYFESPWIIKEILSFLLKYSVSCLKHFLIILGILVHSYYFVFVHRFHSIDMTKLYLQKYKLMVSIRIFPRYVPNIYNMDHILPKRHLAKMSSTACNDSRFPSMLLLLFLVKWWP